MLINKTLKKLSPSLSPARPGFAAPCKRHKYFIPGLDLYFSGTGPGILFSFYFIRKADCFLAKFYVRPLLGSGLPQPSWVRAPQVDKISEHTLL